MSCGILVPWPGTEPGATAVKVPNPHLTTDRQGTLHTSFLKEKNKSSLMFSENSVSGILTSGKMLAFFSEP